MTKKGDKKATWRQKDDNTTVWEKEKKRTAGRDTKVGKKSKAEECRAASK